MTSDVARHLMVDFTQMKSFAEDPLVLEHGEGIRVTDDRGRTYIDGLSGVFTSNLGHGNPEIVDAVATQARKLAFGTPTMGTNTRAAELVEQLLRLVPPHFTTVKLLSGGSEANEAAIKLVRRRQGDSRRVIVAAEGSFHGRTLGALGLTGKSSIRVPFGPFGTDVRFVPFGVDVNAFRPMPEVTSGTDVVTVGADPRRDFALLVRIATRRPELTFRIVASSEHGRTLCDVPANVAVETDIPLEQVRDRLAGARVAQLTTYRSGVG